MIGNRVCGKLTWRVASLGAGLSVRGVMCKRPRASGHRVAVYLTQVCTALHLRQRSGIPSKWVYHMRDTIQEQLQILGIDLLFHGNMASDSIAPEQRRVDMPVVSLVGLLLSCARWSSAPPSGRGLPRSRALDCRAGACSLLDRRGTRRRLRDQNNARPI